MASTERLKTATIRLAPHRSASYSTYAEAERAVDWLSDQRLRRGAQRDRGHGLRSVEQVTGRMTPGRAAGIGAGQGALIGALFALLFGIFFTGPEFIELLLYSLARARCSARSTARSSSTQPAAGNATSDGRAARRSRRTATRSRWTRHACGRRGEASSCSGRSARTSSRASRSSCGDNRPDPGVLDAELAALGGSVTRRAARDVYAELQGR